MSMPNWLNDGQAFPNGDNGSYNPNGDPSMAFMQNPTNPTFDFNQMQNPQLQQRMQNGNVRNGSPGYNNPMYQTQSMIPSKRPRPREDSIGASPQQHPGTLPGSRSQTPQGPFPGYQGGVNGNQQFPGAAPYQQFQQPGNHASPSPVVQNQSFNPQAPHQRVQTMSPSPFSPATQNFAHHTSPPQSEDGSRVNTPQNVGPQFAQGMPYGGAPTQPFTPPIGSQVNGSGLSQYNQHLQAQHQQQQLRMNEMRMRQMQQQRQQAGPLNPMAHASNQMSAPQMAAFRTQQAQEAQQRPSNPAQLLRSLQHYAQQQGQQFNPQPVIAGRPVNSIQLFMTVIRMGGSRKVTAAGHWPNVASLFQFQGQQQMIAASEFQNYWQMSLAGYEQLFGQQQRQRQAMNDPIRIANQGQVSDSASRQEAFSPTRQMHGQPAQPVMQPPHMQAQFHTPTRPMNVQQNDPRHPMPNGYMTPQQGQGPGRQSNNYGMPQPGMQGPPRNIIPIEVQRAPLSKPPRKPPATHKSDPWPNKIHPPLGTEFVPPIDSRDGAEAAWGGIQLEASPQKAPFLETVDNLLRYKLSVPKLEELGLIDIRALTLSLRSGLHAEVRLALDTLASLSKDISGLDLRSCEDLLETLVDCADDQAQLLADNCAEVSDEMLINPYEETIRSCKAENATLQEIPEFGTLEHDLDRAADRLICITTIIRNLSGSDFNQVAIAEPVVIQFMATVIRYIGTRSMLLRTYRNVLDFSKDILTILSNVSQFVDLPGKEDALCILHFLLSFAPLPVPNNGDAEGLSFSSYIPGIHRYYPHAIDSLAKLLARGDPNRMYFKAIFASDAPLSNLLTRSFGLAIAALPELGSLNPSNLIKARLPFLLQGLLAAEILTSLMPSTEHELARSWLTSQDSFALSIRKIVTELGQQPSASVAQRQHPSRPIESDPFGYATITERGFNILRRLTEKAKDSVRSSKEMPYGVFPDKKSVLAAMTIHNISPHITRQLCALSSFDT
ncbi:hypothetical protein ACLMJK_000191 [Lecanora helva]